MGAVEAWEIASPKTQLVTPGDTNNIRATGILLLLGAVIIISGGINYVAKLGTGIMVLLLHSFNYCEKKVGILISLFKYCEKILYYSGCRPLS